MRYLSVTERLERAYVVIPCRHGWETIHCTLDAEGSHPGQLTPEDPCYCGEAVRKPLIDLIPEAGQA